MPNYNKAILPVLLLIKKLPSLPKKHLTTRIKNSILYLKVAYRAKGRLSDALGSHQSMSEYLVLSEGAFDTIILLPWMYTFWSRKAVGITTGFFVNR